MTLAKKVVKESRKVLRSKVTKRDRGGYAIESPAAKRVRLADEVRGDRATRRANSNRDADNRMRIRVDEPSAESLAEIPPVDFSKGAIVRRARGRGPMPVRGRAVTLRLLRIGCDMTQVEVAHAADIAQGDISNIERAALDDRKVSTLARYVEALGGRLEIAAVMKDGQRFVIEAPTDTE